MRPGGCAGIVRGIVRHPIRGASALAGDPVARAAGEFPTPVRGKNAIQFNVSPTTLRQTEIRSTLPPSHVMRLECESQECRVSDTFLQPPTQMIPDNIPTDSAITRRRRLYAMIRKEELGDQVIQELIPNGQPHEYEKQLWDYKSELPVKPDNRNPTETERKQIELKMAEIVKDAVSFYNSYGGYLLIGVSDSPRQISGWDKGFDCDELNKKIKGATKHTVDCHFVTREVSIGAGALKIGLLFIPQRPDDKSPAQFLKDAPQSDTGRKAYKDGDILFRDGHECRPARTADELTFLCSQRRRHFVAPKDEVGFTSVLDNNLGSRDPSFVKFIGRGALLSDLWRWLCDQYTPVKILAGLGGVGKTTLAREFADDIVRSSPMGFERVIWLSAKKRFYVPSLDNYVLATRVDFSDTDTLLRALLIQLGYNEENIDPEWARSALIDEVIEALRVIPSFLIIDDVDSLDTHDQQSELFHAILLIIGRTLDGPQAASRAMLTARLSLGAAAAQLMRVVGLEPKDFDEYVHMTAKSMGLPETVLGKAKDMERLRKVTEGSPTFAASILRLVELGDSLPSALEAWKGSDGEEVRRFAFKRELEQLGDSQVRTLYVLCLLGETSQIELRQITQSSDTLLRDDLGALRKYHLVTLESDIPGSGPRLRIPEAIRLMSGLIKERLRDPKYLEKECARARQGTPQIGVELGHIVHRVVALWRDDKASDALQEVEFASKRNPANGDLKCLLGRAFLRIDPPSPNKADKAFREAHGLGCQRPELIGLWTETKKLLGDWLGLIEVSHLAEQHEMNADGVFYRAEAFGELAEAAFQSGTLSLAAEHYLSGAREINDAFAQRRAIGRVPELKEMRYSFMHTYVRIITRLTGERDRHIEVWLGVLDAFKFFVRSSGLIRHGIEHLVSWWSAVEAREKYDLTSANQLDFQLKQLDNVISVCKKQEVPDDTLLEFCKRNSEALATRLSAYRKSLPA